MRNNFPNIAAFLLLAVGIGAGWWYVERTFFPKPPPPPPDPTEPLRVVPRELAAAVLGTGPAGAPPLTATRPYYAPPKPPEVKEPPKPAPAPPAQTEPHALIALGDDDFFLKVLL